MNIFDYIPYVIKMNEHRAEIDELKTLLVPTYNEFKKVRSEVIALVTKLSNLLAPTVAEFNKVRIKAIPLIVKIYNGMTA